MKSLLVHTQYLCILLPQRHHVTVNTTGLIENWSSFGVARRKPGPKPRRVISSSSQLPPGAPSASLAQLFATADSPRPPSRNEGSDGGSSTSSTCAASAPCTATASTTVPTMSLANHKEGRPRNLGRGVSKPKKNTVASLLAQSRALGVY